MKRKGPTAFAADSSGMDKFFCDNFVHSMALFTGCECDFLFHSKIIIPRRPRGQSISFGRGAIEFIDLMYCSFSK
jgi:hypothetical protein